MSDKRSDQKFDEVRYGEAVISVKRTVAEQLSEILASWDILPKDELRTWLTSIRDELVEDSGAADDEPADPSTNVGSAVHTPPTVTSFEAGSDSEQTSSAVPAVLEPANINMSQERVKTEKISDAAQYREAVSAMESGDVKAKTKVAYYKLTGLGGVEVDEDEAVSLLEERAKDGDNEAKWMLGLCYEYGMGIEQDIERAELLYQESKEGGNVVGKFLWENGGVGRGCGVMKVEGL